jgi:hypothetical protein
MKVCKKCGVEKDVVEFSKQKGMKDGHINTCKVCKSSISRKHHVDNRESNNIKSKVYHLKNKEYFNKLTRNNYQDNKETIKQYQKQYGKDNKDIINKRRRLNMKDPLFKLKANLRSTLSQAFKYKKPKKTEEIIGCTFEEFKIHLETNFEDWMSWDNKGEYNGTLNFGWDIDHIIPLSSATTEEEVLKLNHYTNLQPLCSYINRDIKVDKLDY